MKTRVVHCKKEPYDVYIGRPSIWGNPFAINSTMTQETSLAEYKEYLMNNSGLLGRIKELRGKILGCWCHPKPCHGDILAELADDQTP